MYAGTKYFYEEYYDTSRLGNRQDTATDMRMEMVMVTVMVICQTQQQR
jgi:hypothetical protein